MSIMCPFFKEKCKGNECVMWKDEKCLISSYMEHFIVPPEEIKIVAKRMREDIKELEEYIKTTREVVEREAQRRAEIKAERENEEIRNRAALDEIESVSVEELAAELVSLAKREFPHEERIRISNISRLFWLSKNVDTWSIPPEIQLKKDKVEMLAQRELDHEMEIKMKEQLEKEKSELPSLVSSFVDWARDHGLKKVTHADVDAFLIDKNIKILRQTEKTLYAKANVELRSRF